MCSRSFRPLFNFLVVQITKVFEILFRCWDRSTTFSIHWMFAFSPSFIFMAFLLVKHLHNFMFFTKKSLFCICSTEKYCGDFVDGDNMYVQQYKANRWAKLKVITIKRIFSVKNKTPSKSTKHKHERQKRKKNKLKHKNTQKQERIYNKWQSTDMSTHTTHRKC